MNRSNLIKVTVAVSLLVANLGFLFMARGRFFAKPPKPQQSQFVEASRRGLDAFQKEDFDQAISAWDEAIRLNPNHSEVHRWRGDALLNKREYDSALSEYDEALRLDSKNGMAYCGRGSVLVRKGEFDEAIAALDEATRIEPKFSELPSYKANRAAAERTVQMQKFAEEAKRGFDAFNQKDFDLAIAAWGKAIEFDPDHSEVHRWYGDALRNKQKFEKALAEYDEAIRLDSKNGMAYFCRGIVLTKNKDFKKAITSFDQAIQLDTTIADRADYKRYRTTAGVAQ